MAEISLFGAIRKRWGTLVLSGLLAGSLAFFGLVFFSKSFKATTDFLVVQNAPETQDFYSMLKSSEYLGKVLSESVYSEKFIGAVIETGGVNENFIPSGGKDRLQAWSKIVSVKSNPDAGILHVTVYGNNDRDALRISQAIGKVLVEQNSLFRSGNEKSVEIRVLSGPIIERNPGIETMVVVAGAGVVFGISLVILILLWRMGAFALDSDTSYVSMKQGIASREAYPGISFRDDVQNNREEKSMSGKMNTAGSLVLDEI